MGGYDSMVIVFLDHCSKPHIREIHLALFRDKLVDSTRLLKCQGCLCELTTMKIRNSRSDIENDHVSAQVYKIFTVKPQYQAPNPST
jgi:hypothetical protein